jgi:hypothetical protein
LKVETLEQKVAKRDLAIQAIVKSIYNNQTVMIEQFDDEELEMKYK